MRLLPFQRPGMIPHSIYPDVPDLQYPVPSSRITASFPRLIAAGKQDLCRLRQEMQEGVDTAKYIGETFIKPMVEGKWNWEVTV